MARTIESAAPGLNAKLAGRAAARYTGAIMAGQSDIEIRRKKLLFRAQRRGFREVDLVFGAFAEAHLAGLDGVQLDRFDALLRVPDWQVYDWLVGEAPVPPEHDNDVFALLGAYRSNRKS